MNGHVDEGSDQILDLKRCWTRQHGRLLEALAHKRKVPESSEGGGGGGTLLFSSYVGSGPASTLHPKIISGISSTQKNI